MGETKKPGRIGRESRRAVLEGSDHRRERIAEWRRRVDRLPSAFSRLVLLAGHRDMTTGRYHDLDLEKIFSKDETHHIILEAHEQVFRSWLELPLREQAVDFKIYFDTLGVTRLAPDQKLQWIEFCRDLVPSEASGSDLSLFIGVAQTLLRLMLSSTRR